MVHNCPKMKKKEPDKQYLCVTKNKLNQILIFQVYQNIAHEYYFYFNYKTCGRCKFSDTEHVSA